MHIRQAQYNWAPPLTNVWRHFLSPWEKALSRPFKRTLQTNFPTNNQTTKQQNNQSKGKARSGNEKPVEGEVPGMMANETVQAKEREAPFLVVVWAQLEGKSGFLKDKITEEVGSLNPRDWPPERQRVRNGAVMDLRPWKLPFWKSWEITWFSQVWHQLWGYFGRHWEGG